MSENERMREIEDDKALVTPAKLRRIKNRRRVLHDVTSVGFGGAGDDYLDWLVRPISERKQLAIVSQYKLETLDMCKGVTDRVQALSALLWGRS